MKRKGLLIVLGVAGFLFGLLLRKPKQKSEDGPPPFNPDLYPYAVRTQEDTVRYDLLLVRLIKEMKMSEEDAEAYLATNWQVLPGEPPTEPQA